MLFVKFRMIEPDNSMKTHPLMPRKTHEAHIMMGQTKIGKMSLATNGVYHYELYREGERLGFFQGTRDQEDIRTAIYYWLGLIEDPYNWID